MLSTIMLYLSLFVGIWFSLINTVLLIRGNRMPAINIFLWAASLTATVYFGIHGQF